MWADTLYLAERAHLIQLFAWSGVSVAVGVLLVALPAVRRRSPLLLHLALQTAAWGAVVLAATAMRWRELQYRDLAGYTQLDRMLWLDVGLEVGYVGIGLTLLVTALAFGRRLAPAGAGIGIVVQGLALLVLDL
ncbi:MAG TPA: hypothetical protein VFX39_01730, partial [Gemmatimonadaceae bacterium]|nr:hypothetical protein [Gemmatimonadaceae bacterium]